ncbi:MAG TPA: hypothetical protein GXZ24_07560 [Firmicutes bacterium]|nr:hypothetical protein [Bacillota bacterium]
MPKEKPKRQNRKVNAHWVFRAAIWTFFLAIFFTLVTRFLLESFKSIAFSFLLLLLVIITGITFDIIGTAITAASEKPFHAKAAKKIYGAKKGIYLVRNADRVANFCNDVVGDILGIVSGVVAAVIIINLVLACPGLNEIILSILLTGLVSALTVGGKAFGKTLALNKTTHIVFSTAKMLTTFDNIFLRTGRNKSKKKSTQEKR